MVIVVKTALHPCCEVKALFSFVADTASPAKLYPTFRRNPSGYLWLQTPNFKSVSHKEPLQGQCGTTHGLWAEALKKVRSIGGDDRQEQQVMGQVVVQFGQHAGETSLWLVENCVGCAAYLVISMKVEKECHTPLKRHKFMIEWYSLSLSEGKDSLKMKEEEENKKLQKKAATSSSSPASFLPLLL